MVKFTLVAVISAISIVRNVIGQFSEVGENCLPHIPENFGCSKHEESFTDPENCNQYITCLSNRYCDEEKHVGFRYSSCPKGTLHNQALGTCERVVVCPTNPTDVIDPAEICKKVGEKFGVSQSCTYYMECVKEKKVWKWKKGICPNDYNFNKTSQQCEPGPCEGCLFPMPHYAKCTNVSIVFGHPTDCQKYFECVKNEPKCKGDEWGRLDKTCPEGAFFDAYQKRCIEGECQQVCPPKMLDQNACKNEMDLVDDPSCSGKAVCMYIDSCPEQGFQPYWTAACASCLCKNEGETFGFYSTCKKFVSCVQALDTTWSWKFKECPNGRHYNRTSGKCSEGNCPGCPSPIAPEFIEECDQYGPKFPHLTNCTMYHVCIKAPPKCEIGDWGQIEESCPEGKFYDVEDGICVDTCNRECPIDIDEDAPSNGEICLIEDDIAKNWDKCKEGEIPVCRQVLTCQARRFEPYFTVVCNKNETSV